MLPSTLQKSLLAPGERLALSACDRFFLVHELVVLCLEQVDTSGLVKCQRVCHLWKDIIEWSQDLQERLFKVPSQQPGGAIAAVRLNPILGSHFSPLLAIRSSQLASSAGIVAWETEKCRYADLEQLPWARNGISTRAYSRPEASWRKMLISQPPISYCNWWHTWECTTGRGYGHRKYSGAITIGMLWDWLEALLLRECHLQVTFFPAGAWPPDDPSASEREKAWIQTPRTPSHTAGFRSDLPRIRITSHQVWPGTGPNVHQIFDVQKREWTISTELPFTPQTEKEALKYQVRNYDGYKWLVIDCHHDSDHSSSNWRWSKSDAFELITMDMVNAARGRWG